MIKLSKILLSISLVGVIAIAVADFYGVFICSGCNPNQPHDPDTELFIRSEVNQEVDDDDWDTDDYVEIRNEDGERGLWGRASALSAHALIAPLPDYCGVSCDHTPGEQDPY